MIGSNIRPFGIKFGALAASSNVIIGYESYIDGGGNWIPWHAKEVVL